MSWTAFSSWDGSRHNQCEIGRCRRRARRRSSRRGTRSWAAEMLRVISCSPLVSTSVVQTWFGTTSTPRLRPPGRRMRAQVDGQATLLVGLVDEQHVVRARPGQVEGAVLALRVRTVDLVRQRAVLGERDPGGDAGGGGHALRGLLVGVGLLGVLADRPRAPGSAVVSCGSISRSPSMPAAAPPATRPIAPMTMMLIDRPVLDRGPVGEEEGEGEEDHRQHAEREHGVGLRQPQHDAAERVDDDADGDRRRRSGTRTGWPCGCALRRCARCRPRPAPTTPAPSIRRRRRAARSVPMMMIA